MHYATKNIRRTLVTVWNYTWRSLDIACHLINFHKVDVSGPLLERDPCGSILVSDRQSLHFGWSLTGGLEVRLYVIFSHASVLNRVYNFVRVCPNYKQGIGCAIGLICLMKFVCTCKQIKEINTMWIFSFAIN